MFGNPNQLQSIFGNTNMQVIDLERNSVRELNEALQNQSFNITSNNWEINNPKGNHAVAVGINAKINVKINGSTGYYCSGMNQLANVHVHGSVGPGVCENMMSGEVIIEGDASQYAGATGHGGLLLVKGNSSSRCGISMKGIDIVVFGNVGHMSAFMAQSGNLVILGNSGEGLGDSIYEANVFIRGKAEHLGADCIEKEIRSKHIKILERLLDRTEANAQPEEFRRYGSARNLYNFNVDNLKAY
jgi:glutamate synthase domain-containing protein 3